VTLDPVFDAVRRGLYAFMSLTAGGLVAGAVMFLAMSLTGLGGFFVGLVGLFVWPIAMLCVGGPVWVVLHRLGRRDLRTARIAGAVGGGVFVPLVIAAALSGSADGEPLWWLVSAAFCIAAGALSGGFGAGAVWSLAYGGRRDARA